MPGRLDSSFEFAAMCPCGGAAGGGAAGGGAGILIGVALNEILDTSNKVKLWVEASVGTNNRKDQHVYVLQDPRVENVVKYVGRTNNPARRQLEHKNDPKHPERKNYKMLVLASGLTREQAMLLEQVLISAYSLSYLENARREIAVGNVGKYHNYMTAVSEIVQGIAEVDLINLIGG